MTVYFTESFAWSDTASDYVNYKGYSQMAATPRQAGGAWTGSYYAATGANNPIAFPLGAASTQWLGWRHNCNGWTQRMDLQFTGLLSLQTDASGHLIISNGTSTLATGPVISTNWHYIEVELINGTGIGAVYVDGVNASMSGSDTATYSGSTVTYTCYQAFVQDVYVADAMLGDRQVTYRAVNGAGASTQFSPAGAASNYLCVDDAPHPDGDTTYVTTATVGNRDLYALPSLPQTTVASIAAVATYLVARKDNTSPRGVKATVRSSTTNADGPETLLDTGLDYNNGKIAEIASTDPSTGAAWTLSGANAAQAGILLSS